MKERIDERMFNWMRKGRRKILSKFSWVLSIFVVRIVSSFFFFFWKSLSKLYCSFVHLIVFACFACIARLLSFNQLCSRFSRRHHRHRRRYRCRRRHHRRIRRFCVSLKDFQLLNYICKFWTFEITYLSNSVTHFHFLVLLLLFPLFATDVTTINGVPAMLL